MKGSQTVKVMDAFKEAVEHVIKQITTSTTLQLEADTPELTGFAESNWIPQIGSQRAEPIGSQESVDFNALETGIALVASTYKLPSLVYISNPVSYITTLNTGSSRQAPRDFVQTSIAKAIKSII